MKMCFADFHCDTLTQCSEMGLDFFENGLQNDLKFAQNFDSFFSVFAIFIPENLSRREAFIYYQKNIEYFYRILSRHTDRIELVKSYEDFKSGEGKIRIALSIENFSFADEEEVEKAYADGVRFASLTWNSDNSLAGGAMGKSGLTREGKAVLRKMEELGIAADLSHLNRESARDILKTCRRPVLATHSSSYSLCQHPRNLTDEEYKEVINTGGIVGVNFYREFLGRSRTIDEIAEHIEYYYKLDPEGVVFGSDFDGAEMPDGLSGLCDMHKVFGLLLERDFDSDILYRNAEKFMGRMF